MLTRILLCFATLALVVASAASSHNLHNLTLFEPATINGTLLQPGDYKIEVTDNKVAVRSGKRVVAEADVKVEANGSKYPTTTVRYVAGADSNKVQEIRIGGTATKLIFDTAGAVAR